MKPKTLIFLHGGPGLQEYLAPFFKAKFEIPHLVHEVFYTQTQKVTSIEDQLNELETHVAKANGDVYLIGHSWGGFLASEYALRHPQKIKGLVLISSGFSSEYKGKGTKILEEKGLLKKEPLLQYLTESELPEWKESIQKILDEFNGDVYKILDESYMLKFDNEKRLKKASFPILTIYGDHDYVIYADHQKRLGSLSSQIKTVVIKDAGHFPFLLKEHRDLVIRSIKDFVQ